MYVCINGFFFFFFFDICNYNLLIPHRRISQYVRKVEGIVVSTLRTV